MLQSLPAKWARRVLPYAMILLVMTGLTHAQLHRGDLGSQRIFLLIIFGKDGASGETRIVYLSDIIVN